MVICENIRAAEAKEEKEAAILVIGNSSATTWLGHCLLKMGDALDRLDRRADALIAHEAALQFRCDQLAEREDDDELFSLPSELHDTMAGVAESSERVGQLLIEVCPLRWREAKELLEDAVRIREHLLREFLASLTDSDERYRAPVQAHRLALLLATAQVTDPPSLVLAYIAPCPN